MKKFKISLQSIIFWMLGLSLIPRLLTPYAFQIGTLYILLFCIPFLVINAEIVDEYESKKKLFEIPKFNLIIIASLVSIIFTSFFYRNLIFEESAGSLITNLRRILYLIQPMIFLSVYQSVKKDKKFYFLLMITFMTFLMGVSLVLPTFLEGTYLSYKLNNFTAYTGSTVFSFITKIDTDVVGVSFGNANFMIKVMHGCSSLNQIIISIFTIIIFFICCKIDLKKNQIMVILFAILSAFFINGLRIALLAYLVSKNYNESFDFWHLGAGSLIFSFVIMTCTCSFYYYIWTKENT